MWLLSWIYDRLHFIIQHAGYSFQQLDIFICSFNEIILESLKMENIKGTCISIVIKAVFDSASPINPNKDLWFQVSLLGLLSYYVYV